MRWLDALLAFGHSKELRREESAREKIKLIRGDLTSQETDAVVNAADWTLMGGTGVDGAIHEVAGPQLLEYIKRSRARIETGGIFVTPGFNLKAKMIIHTCAPVYDPWDVKEGMRVLAYCYAQALRAASANDCLSVSFPILGSGAFWWPADLALKSAKSGIEKALVENGNLREINLIAFDDLMFEQMNAVFKRGKTNRI